MAGSSASLHSSTVPGHRPGTLSARLADVSGDGPDGRDPGSRGAEAVPLGDVIDRAGGGAGLLLLLGAIALVPGIAVACSVALCAVAASMLLGGDHMALPGFLRRRTIGAGRLRSVIGRVLPWARRLERCLRPRLPWLSGAAGRRLAGLACLANGILVLLPIPFGNTAPAVATILVAAGLLGGDGAVVAAGLGATVLALVLDGVLIAGSWHLVSAAAGAVLGG